MGLLEPRCLIEVNACTVRQFQPAPLSLRVVCLERLTRGIYTIYRKALIIKIMSRKSHKSHNHFSCIYLYSTVSWLYGLFRWWFELGQLEKSGSELLKFKVIHARSRHWCHQNDPMHKLSDTSFDDHSYNKTWMQQTATFFFVVSLNYGLSSTARQQQTQKQRHTDRKTDRQSRLSKPWHAPNISEYDFLVNWRPNR